MRAVRERRESAHGFRRAAGQDPGRAAPAAGCRQCRGVHPARDRHDGDLVAPTAVVAGAPGRGAARARPSRRRRRRRPARPVEPAARPCRHRSGPPSPPCQAQTCELMGCAAGTVRSHAADDGDVGETGGRKAGQVTCSVGGTILWGERTVDVHAQMVVYDTARGWGWGGSVVPTRDPSSGLRRRRVRGAGRSVLRPGQHAVRAGPPRGHPTGTRRDQGLSRDVPSRGRRPGRPATCSAAAAATARRAGRCAPCAPDRPSTARGPVRPPCRRRRTG